MTDVVDDRIAVSPHEPQANLHPVLPVAETVSVEAPHDAKHQVARAVRLGRRRIGRHQPFGQADRLRSSFHRGVHLRDDRRAAGGVGSRTDERGVGRLAEAAVGGIAGQRQLLARQRAGGSLLGADAT